MKKALLFTIICAVTVSLSFGQSINPDPLLQQTPHVHTQSMSLTSPSAWIPGTQVTLNVFLTFGGYDAYGLSYWLEVPTAIAPFLSITAVQYFTFNDPSNTFGLPIVFTDSSGARPGYLTTHAGPPTPGGGTGVLGATTQPLTLVPPGTYLITALTFSLANGLPLGSYTMYSTSILPRASEVTDPDFNDNDIPPAPFVFAVIPEPSTFALLIIALVPVALGRIRATRVRRTRTG
ncbi:MAG: hypothetical protein ABI925_06780 [Verrucomicrobiota bacterium]